MSDMRFYVRAIWDDEAKVLYSQTNIIGLHIEAANIDEFEKTMMELAPAFVIENHISKRDLVQKSWADMMPAIFFNPNDGALATA